MVNGLLYQKQKIGELLNELYDLTGRVYEVERIGGKIKLKDTHSMFSNGIYADNYKEFRWMLKEVVDMIKLSHNWINPK